jgi:hypothetical protein
MVQNKKCGDYPMSCDGENCLLDFQPEKEFRWWKTVWKKGYHCSVNIRIINGDNLESNLFMAADHSCKLDGLIVPTIVMA